MFPRPYEEAAKRSKAIASAPFEVGCTLDYVFVTPPFLTLVLLPELHISDTEKSKQAGSFHSVGLIEESR
jgi:adenine deaminase